MLGCSILATYYTKHFLCEHDLCLPRKMQTKDATTYFAAAMMLFFFISRTVGRPFSMDPLWKRKDGTRIR
jgi:hypothetical protein